MAKHGPINFCIQDNPIALAQLAKGKERTFPPALRSRAHLRMDQGQQTISITNQTSFHANNKTSIMPLRQGKIASCSLGTLKAQKFASARITSSYRHPSRIPTFTPRFLAATYFGPGSSIQLKYGPMANVGGII